MKATSSNGFIILLALLCMFSSATSASGQVVAPEVSQALEKTARVPVVIALRGPTSPPIDSYSPRQLTSKMTAIAATRNKVLARLSSTDFTLTHEWEAISAVAGQVTSSGLAKLLADPDVLRVDLDTGGTGGLAQSVSLIHADVARQRGLTGRGVTIAVLDSGLDTTHPDLADDLLAEQCFCANPDGTGCCPNGSTVQSGPGSAEDDHGHGTNVTGIVASNGYLASTGVAPEAKIVAVKVLDRFNRFVSSAQVLSGLNWLIVNRPEVRVVNMSLGTSALFSGACDEATAFTLAFADAINTLKTRGVMVFAASLNNGSATLMSAPACVANAVSVGAVYTADIGPFSFGATCRDAATAVDQVTCFTNSNSTLDLLAPGAPIRSTGLRGGTSIFIGTSQASPHAAAAAALLLQADPALTPEQIETKLKVTGVSVTDAKNGLSFPRIDLLSFGCATDATEQVRIARGGFIFNPFTRRSVQVVLLQNRGMNPVLGPVALVLDELSSTATLLEADGTTSCVAPAGSPYINIGVGGDGVLSPGETRLVVLRFANPDNQPISYQARVLAGSDDR